MLLSYLDLIQWHYWLLFNHTRWQYWKEIKRKRGHLWAGNKSKSCCSSAGRLGKVCWTERLSFPLRLHRVYDCWIWTIRSSLLFLRPCTQLCLECKGYPLFPLGQKSSGLDAQREPNRGCGQAVGAELERGRRRRYVRNEEESGGSAAARLRVPEAAHETPKARSSRSTQETSTLPTHTAPELTLEAAGLREVPSRGDVTRLILRNVRIFIRLPPLAICLVHHPHEGKLEVVPGRTAWWKQSEQREDSVLKSPAGIICQSGSTTGVRGFWNIRLDTTYWRLVFCDGGKVWSVSRALLCPE